MRDEVGAVAAGSVERQRDGRCIAERARKDRHVLRPGCAARTFQGRGRVTENNLAGARAGAAEVRASEYNQRARAAREIGDVQGYRARGVRRVYVNEVVD